LWRLGEHRLICGDSTDSATIAHLLDRDRARLVATDPPYGMSYDGGQAGKFDVILGDDARGEALVDLVAGALTAARPHTRKGAAWYVCLTWRTYSEFARAMARAELPINACIVWDKGSPGLGYQHYRPQHEFVLYSAGDRWHGEHAERDVWSFTRGNTGEYVHPTQKPVALLERMVRNSSRTGDVVLDLFGGSGSTLIACERLDRRARLVELDPRYCDAIVRRWEKITGKTAEREGP
jgi:DNA modification methylase